DRPAGRGPDRLPQLLPDDAAAGPRAIRSGRDGACLNSLRRGMTKPGPLSGGYASRLPLDDAFALTFDDGPDATYTPLVLEALARADVKATFFVIGSQVEQSPHLVHQIVA